MVLRRRSSPCEWRMIIVKHTLLVQFDAAYLLVFYDFGDSLYVDLFYGVHFYIQRVQLYTRKHDY